MARYGAQMTIKRTLKTLARIVRGSPVITLDYPINVTPRYGHGKPPHPELFEMVHRCRDDYVALLSEMNRLNPWLEAIPENAVGSGPHWSNPHFTGADAAALYALLVMHDPRRFIEVGSGNSTRFARQAIRDHKLRTSITCIDPAPRADVTPIADRFVRQALQDANLEVYSEVESGDVISLDGSHYAYQNSDTAVFFLEVLPRLPQNVLVHVHDIRIPNDYPTKIRDLWYGEQYVLAAWLLGRGQVKVAWCGAYAHDPDLAVQLPPAAKGRGGSSFWFWT